MDPHNRVLTPRIHNEPIQRGKGYWEDIHHTDCEATEADGLPCGGIVLVMTSLEAPTVPVKAYCLRCGQHYVPAT